MLSSGWDLVQFVLGIALKTAIGGSTRTYLDAISKVQRCWIKHKLLGKINQKYIDTSFLYYLHLPDIAQPTGHDIQRHYSSLNI